MPRPRKAERADEEERRNKSAGRTQRRDGGKALGKNLAFDDPPKPLASKLGHFDKIHHHQSSSQPLAPIDRRGCYPAPRSPAIRLVTEVPTTVRINKREDQLWDRHQGIDHAAKDLIDPAAKSCRDQPENTAQDEREQRGDEGDADGVPRTIEKAA